MNNLPFLEESHPELFKLLSKAKELYANNELEMSACQLRIYGEKFLSIFCDYQKINIPNEITTQFEKLDFLEKEYPAIFTPNIHSKIHKIRIIGNNGAHGNTVTKFRLKEALIAADSLVKELKNIESNKQNNDANGLIGLTLIATIGATIWFIRKAFR